MCTTCGCHPQTHQHENHHTDSVIHHHEHHEEIVHEGKRVAVEMDVLTKNNRLAQVNRQRFASQGVFVVNLVSSPGSGKTTLLERTLNDLRGSVRCSVIEGDQQTDNDAVRIAATGAPVRQINTGSGCHLDAHMVGHAADELPLHTTDILFIENVGNLVCPASFDLGEHHKVVVLSVTEGEDKPLKYPQMFRAAHVMLINKMDLSPYVPFDVERCREMARKVNPSIEIFQVSAADGTGMEQWYQWLRSGSTAARHDTAGAGMDR